MSEQNKVQEALADQIAAQIKMIMRNSNYNMRVAQIISNATDFSDFYHLSDRELLQKLREYNQRFCETAS